MTALTGLMLTALRWDLAEALRRLPNDRTGEPYNTQISEAGFESETESLSNFDEQKSGKQE